MDVYVYAICMCVRHCCCGDVRASDPATATAVRAPRVCSVPPEARGTEPEAAVPSEVNAQLAQFTYCPIPATPHVFTMQAGVMQVGGWVIWVIWVTWQARMNTSMLHVDAAAYQHMLAGVQAKGIDGRLRPTPGCPPASPHTRVLQCLPHTHAPSDSRVCCVSAACFGGQPARQCSSWCRTSWHLANVYAH